MPKLKEQIKAALEAGREVAGLLSGAQALDLGGLVFSGQTLDDIQIKGLSFAGARFARVRFLNSRIAECDFHGATFIECVFSNCTVLDCVFDRAVFNGTQVGSCRFERVSAAHSAWSGTRVSDSVFAASTFDRCRFADAAAFLRSSIENSCAGRAVFCGVETEDFALLDSSLSRSAFTDTSFIRPRFEHSYFRRCSFASCRWDSPVIRGNDFSRAVGLDAQDAGLDLAADNRGLGAAGRLSGRNLFALGVLVLVAVVLWNLVYNPIFISSPRLADMAVACLDREDYLGASAPVRVLARRHKELPPEVIERMAMAGLENLAIVLSRDVAMNALDSTSEALVRTLSAETDWNDGRRREALDKARRIIKEPIAAAVSKRLLMDVGRWSYELGDRTTALWAAESLVGLNYDVGSVAFGYKLKGRVLLARGRAGAALELFEKALALETDKDLRAELAALMARLYLDRGRTGRVMTLVRESGAQGSQAQIKRIQAQVLMREGDYGGAENLLREALPLARSRAVSVSVLLSLAHACLENGKTDDARQVMKKVVMEGHAPDAMAEIAGMNASIAAASGDFASARSLYEDAIGYSRNVNILNWLYLDLARVYLALDLDDEALRVCEKVEELAIAPVFAAEAKEIRASVFLRRDNRALACALLEGALELSMQEGAKRETAADIALHLARLYRDAESTERVAGLCRFVLDFDATGDRAAEAEGFLAETELAAGNDDTARALFESAFAKTRDEGLRVWIGLEIVRLLDRAGQSEKAEQLAAGIIDDCKVGENRERARLMLEGIKTRLAVADEGKA